MYMIPIGYILKNTEQNLQFKHSKHLISFLSKWLPHVSKRERTIINVMIGYAAHWNPETNLMFPSQLRVAHKVDCTTKTVERAVKTLKDSRVFSVIKRQRKTSLIGFNFNALLHFLKMSVQKCLSNKFSKENYIFKQVNTIAHDIFNAEQHIEKRIKQAAKTAYKTGQSALRQIFNSALASKQRPQQQATKQQRAAKYLSLIETKQIPFDDQLTANVFEALAVVGIGENDMAYAGWVKFMDHYAKNAKQ